MNNDIFLNKNAFILKKVTNVNCEDIFFKKNKHLPYFTTCGQRPWLPIWMNVFPFHYTLYV